MPQLHPRKNVGNKILTRVNLRLRHFKFRHFAPVGAKLEKPAQHPVFADPCRGDDWSAIETAQHMFRPNVNEFNVANMVNQAAQNPSYFCTLVSVTAFPRDISFYALREVHMTPCRSKSETFRRDSISCLA